MLRLKIQFKCYLLKESLSEHASLHLTPLNSKATPNIHTQRFLSRRSALRHISLHCFDLISIAIQPHLSLLNNSAAAYHTST